MRFISLIILSLFGSVVAPCVAQSAALERGVAVTDPLALRELDNREILVPGLDNTGFGLGRILDRKTRLRPFMSNAELFSLPSMWSVRKVLDAEFDRYIAMHRARSTNESIGVGASFDVQLFDRSVFDSDEARFVLAGIISRIDRAYVSPESCGEIRLIYRLVRTRPVESDQGITLPRLPMTLNVVLKANSERMKTADGVALACSEIARRWLATANWPQTGERLAIELMSPGGPLELAKLAGIDRIETNLQIAHAPKSAVREFRTDYLLKLFRYNPRTHAFEEGPLENQIDRDRILADDNLKREFRTWLLDPKNFSEFDRGTVLIPEKFLAKGAIAATPVGLASSNLQPAFGFVQADGYGNEVFGESEVVAALKKASDSGIAMQNIQSVAGFERRLNDMTCSGCHQTRGIGGFHFPGVDWMAAKPSNSAVVPASLHFFGDQIRRRDILTSISNGAPPDFSRGFSDRPQLRGSTELAGTEYDDGWGARCYQQKAAARDNDKSFRAWTCADGLACQSVESGSRIGMCFVKSR